MGNAMACMMIDAPEMRPPRVTHADLPLELWLEIFRYATYVPRARTILPPDPFAIEQVSRDAMGTNTSTSSMRTKRSLVLVSRSWRRVAVELLYEHLVISSPRRADLILSALCRGRRFPEKGKPISEYGQWTRHIEVHTCASRAESVNFLNKVANIMSHCPNVRFITGKWTRTLPHAFLDFLSGLYGSTLQGLHWDEHPKSTNPREFMTPKFWGSLQALFLLDLRSCAESIVPIFSEGEIPILPCLETLSMSTHASSILIATAIRLPKLRRLVFDMCTQYFQAEDQLTEFLRVHGAQIAHLELVSPNCASVTHVNMAVFLQPGVCPNLVELVFPSREPLMDDLEQPHNSLRRVGIRGVYATRLYPKYKTRTAGHLRKLTRETFPALELVRTISFLVEGSVDINAKDVFIWWAEEFESDGIDFQDGEGVVWLYEERSGGEASTAKLLTDTVQKEKP